jgi:hypothetical protein
MQWQTTWKYISLRCSPISKNAVLIWSFPGHASLSWQGQYWDDNECGELVELLTGENWSTRIKVLSQWHFVYHNSHMHPGLAQCETGVLTIFEQIIPFRWTYRSRQEWGRAIAKAKKPVYCIVSILLGVGVQRLLFVAGKTSGTPSCANYTVCWIVSGPSCSLSSCEWYAFQFIELRVVHPPV